MIILPAHHNNEYNDEGANIIAVHVDIKELEKRTALVDRLKKKDTSLTKMCYWDSLVNFYNLTDAQISQLLCKADKVVEDQYFFRKPGDIMEEYGDPLRVDCCQMIVWDRGHVSWSAYDHYCSDRFESDQIDIKIIQLLVKTKKEK